MIVVVLTHMQCVAVPGRMRYTSTERSLAAYGYGAVQLTYTSFE